QNAYNVAVWYYVTYEIADYKAGSFLLPHCEEVVSLEEYVSEDSISQDFNTGLGGASNYLPVVGLNWIDEIETRENLTCKLVTSADPLIQVIDRCGFHYIDKRPM